MEEIYPGMPTFYFLMIVGAISGIVGSLVGYRVIQQARIPKYVKKLRFVKKKIKGRESIPGVSIASKDHMILKQFGGLWEEIGLSLEDTFGITDTKPTTFAKIKDQFKKDGGAS